MAALPFYQKAVALDPNFAMAYRAMAAVYANQNEPERAPEHHVKPMKCGHGPLSGNDSLSRRNITWRLQVSWRRLLKPMIFGSDVLAEI